MQQYLQCWCASIVISTWRSDAGCLFHTFISGASFERKGKNETLQKKTKTKTKTIVNMTVWRRMKVTCWMPGDDSFDLFLHEPCKPLWFLSPPYIDLLLDGLMVFMKFKTSLDAALMLAFLNTLFKFQPKYHDFFLHHSLKYQLINH